MPHNNLLITHLGYMAERVINRISNGSVFGKSKRGIFIQPPDDLTIYISFENFRGPLTLNLSGSSVLLDQIKPGNPVVLKKSEFLFPDTGLRISLEQAEIWQQNRNHLKSRLHQDQLENVVSQAKKISGNESLFPLLEMVISGDPAPLPDHPGLTERFFKVLDAMRGLSPGPSVETRDILNALTGLLGAGPGLTPLGDDFILGVLLTQNRWRHLISPNLAQFKKGDSTSRPYKTLNHQNQIILENAREKTTRLSYSLLTCAVEGSADERILKILDGLIAGEEIQDQDLTRLLNWGSSSGIAVLAGMIFALKEHTVSS